MTKPKDMSREEYNAINRAKRAASRDEVNAKRREYYRNNNLNIPEQYHNGGIWPFVGGFYIAALVKAGRMDQAMQQLEKLAEVNHLGIDGEWEFNEWCHGRTGKPMGYPHQAWSAGMYTFAYHCVETETVPILNCR